MQISEIMHQGIVSAQINDSVKKVASIMKTEDIGALPIMENGKPVGIVTDRDIVITCVAAGHSVDDPITHAMTRNVFTVEPSASLEEAAKIMQQNQVSRLVVVENNKPVGMISLQDITESLDEDLAGEVVSEIKRQ